MVRTSQTLEFGDIVEINRRMIHAFGGLFVADVDNLLNPGSLDHILEAIQGSVFGYDPYPTLVEKAAALAWRIIVGHVFHDGNKRTGVDACRQLLELNGYAMRMDEEVVDIAIRIATAQMPFVDFVRWLEARAQPIA